jgi:hypothetical protein
VCRVGHTVLVVVDLPDLLCASLHHDWDLIHAVGPAINEPSHPLIVGGHGERLGLLAAALKSGCGISESVCGTLLE